MTRKIKITASPASNPAPTYLDLAELVAELTEINIANLDGQHRFVSCFTYGAGVMPPHWQRAIDAREALIENQMILRRDRHK